MPPCCGVRGELRLESTIRPKVFICDTCSIHKKDHSPRWEVDISRPTKALREYFQAREDYIIAENCFEDKVYVEKTRRKYFQLKEKRKPSLVVATEGMDGVSPLADFKDSNLALSFALGWLGGDYTQIGECTWVSMYGSVLVIIEM